MTRIVAGPSGVSEVRHTAPASSMRKVGSLRPRPWTDSVTRTSRRKGACHSRTRAGSGLAAAAVLDGAVPVMLSPW